MEDFRWIVGDRAFELRTRSMKRLFVVATLGVVNASSIAAADVSETTRPQATYKVVDGPVYRGFDVVHAAPGFSNVIYLNNCKPNGCRVTPGNDNSINNTSGIPSQTSTVPPWAFSDATWNQVVDFVKQ